MFDMFDDDSKDVRFTSFIIFSVSVDTIAD